MNFLIYNQSNPYQKDDSIEKTTIKYIVPGDILSSVLLLERPSQAGWLHLISRNGTVLNVVRIASAVGQFGREVQIADGTDSNERILQAVENAPDRILKSRKGFSKFNVNFD